MDALITWNFRGHFNDAGTREILEEIRPTMTGYRT